MCLAIYKPEGKTVDWDALEEGFRSNSDGAGFAYVRNDRLLIHRGLFSFDAFKTAFEPHAKRQAIIHFRLATHGNKDKKNCHPFRINDNLCLIHNGILPIKCNQDKDMSDTWHYANLILKPMAERDPDFYMRSEIVFMGEAAIGSNKFVFLSADGNFSIWNDDAGHWVNDVWYSNRSYQKSCSLIRTPWYREPYSSSTTSSTTIVPVAKASVEVADLYSEYDTNLSSQYDSLTDRDQQVYDMLIDDGWDVGTLDDIVEMQGVNGLFDLLKYSLDAADMPDLTAKDMTAAADSQATLWDSERADY